jgi:hypothetical protein
MDPYMPMDNSSVLLPWCRLMLLLRGPTPKQSLDNALSTIRPPSFGSMYRAATPTCPGFYFAQRNGAAFLLLDGAVGLNQAILLTAGYVGTAHPAITNPSNFYLRDAATEVVTSIRADNFPRPNNLRVCGYSLGGAIAPFLPFEFNRQGFGDDRGNILSFGAPKTAGFRNNQTLGVNDRCTRLMCDNDPVPIFPPGAIDFLAVIALVGPIHAARLSNFTHPGRGSVINNEGIITAATVPAVSNLDFGVNLANWLWSTENGQDNAHALTEYEKRLILMEGRNNRAFHIPQAPIQRQAELQRNELNPQERRVVDTIVTTGRRQGIDNVSLPVEKIFRWVRVGRINCVAFGDKLVTITSTKKRALRMANSGNDFLRVMQRQAVVDPVSMTQQFINYFQFAVQGDLGFRPALNIIMPPIGN